MVIFFYQIRKTDCGFALDEKQADKFQKELVKSWGFEQEDD